MSPEEILNDLQTLFADSPLPSVSLLAEEGAAPFEILISTLISLRTRDDTTLAASRRLFSLAKTPEKMAVLPLDELESAIYPAGFYKKKAENIRLISHIVHNNLKDRVPSDRSGLLSLPGVGIKTAALVRSLAFNIDDLCVDTHVHRIANRMGWVVTRKPEETELALKNILNPKDWRRTNELLILFGSKTCLPTSPLCTTCPFQKECPKAGVSIHR